MLLALATALLCFVLSAVLAVKAARRLGVAWLLLRPREERERRRLVGVLEPRGATVQAPFSERAVLYVRARLRGVGPEGGAVRVLWEKVLAAPAQITGARDALTIDLASAQVLVPREYRQGALRALMRDVRLLPRVLARAGYHSPPPLTQFFELEEEVLLAGQPVSVLGERDEQGTLAPTPGTPMVVSNLTRWRILLRIAWGPALALLLAAILALTGVGVLGTGWWLR
jgi:hypothetical protein